MPIELLGYATLQFTEKIDLMLYPLCCLFSNYTELSSKGAHSTIVNMYMKELQAIPNPLNNSKLFCFKDVSVPLFTKVGTKLFGINSLGFSSSSELLEADLALLNTIRQTPNPYTEPPQLK